MTFSDSPPPKMVLYEREAALAAIAEAIGGARSGLGKVLFIVGAGGLGKTALLRSARSMAGEGMPVLDAKGAYMESDIPFAYVEQLLSPLLPEGEVAGSPEPLPPAPDPLSRRNAAFEAARKRLRAIADAGPALILADDMQWADGDSTNLFSFLARRTSHLPTAIVAALRPWPTRARTMALALTQVGEASLISLAPLSPTSSDSLLDDLLGAEVDADLRDRVRAVAKGNPLFIREATLTLAARGELYDGRPGAHLSGRGRLLLSQLAGFSQASLRCARAAAVLGGCGHLSALAEVSGLDPVEFVPAVDSLVQAGVLVELPSARVEFSHDLIATAVYQDIGPAERIFLHRRAYAHFARIGDRLAAAPHAVSADLVGDREAVRLVHQVARDAMAAGAVRSGLYQLKAAMRLAGPEPGDDLVTSLALGLTAANQPIEALETYDRLEGHDLDSDLRREVLVGKARAQVLAGRFDEGLETYKALSHVTWPSEAAEVSMMAERSHAIWERHGPVAALSSLEKLPSAGPAVLDNVLLKAQRAWFRMQHNGDLAGLGDIEAAVAKPAMQPAGSADDQSYSLNAFLLHAGTLAVLERFAEAEEVVETGVALLSHHQFNSAIVHLRCTRPMMLINAGKPFAILSEIEDIDQEMELGPLIRPRFMIWKAQALNMLGRTTESADLCDAAASSLSARGWNGALSLGVATGWRLLIDRRPTEALDAFFGVNPSLDRVAIGSLTTPPWSVGVLRASVEAQRFELLGELVQWLEGPCAALPCVWPRLAALTGRAELAARAEGGAEEAERAYTAALALPEVNPLYRAWVLLRFGSWLRRARQPGRARPVLGEALRTAESSGASALAERAHAELMAAGGRRRRDGGSQGLSPQQRRVAQMAVTGATSPEIATALGLSPRTVETHLAGVYLKLGVAGRAELRQRRDQITPPLSA